MYLFVYVNIYCKLYVCTRKLFLKPTWNRILGKRASNSKNLRSMRDLCIVHELANDTERQQLLPGLVIVIGVI